MELRNFGEFLNQKLGVPHILVPRVEALVEVKMVPKEDYVLRAGQVCNHSFFVEKGLLRLYALNAAGHPNILQFAPECAITDDRGSVYFREASRFYIDAVEDSVVVLMDRDFAAKVSELSPGFSEHNERLLQNHLRTLYGRVASLLGASAKERYTEFVRTYPDVLSRVPQWMVASYLGITPESLSRVRRDILDGTVQRDGRK